LVKLAQPELKNIHVPIDVYRMVLPWMQAAPIPSRHGALVMTSRAPRTAAAAALILIIAGAALWRYQHSAVTTRPASPSSFAPPSRADDRKSIAVLPFVNMSSDKENEYFSDGITEDLITALSKISGLHVAARTSSFAFKGKNEDIRAIGERLHVGAVLEGSVAKSGNQVRITAQLINVANGYHLWSESYDRELQDIFAIRSQVARTVAKALEVALVEGERQKLDKKPTEDVEAYQLYLKGLHAVSTYANWQDAMRYFQQAIARDPNFAPVYTGIAYFYVSTCDSTLPGSEALPRAREAAKKALQLDPSLAEAHTWLGYVAWGYDYDYATSRREFETAIAMQPDLAIAHVGYGWQQMSVGPAAEALAGMRRAVELDPLSAVSNVWLGAALYLAGRNDEAIRQLRTTITLDPDYWYAHMCLGRAYAVAGRTADLLAEAETAQRLAAPGDPEAEAALGRAYADAGKKAEAMKVLEHLRQRSQNEFISAAFLASVQTGLNQVDEAFASLEQAVAQRSYYVLQLRVDPGFARLRSDPRFTALLKKVGLDQ
jgi:TolB-like protein/lipoprotein NlpI